MLHFQVRTPWECIPMKKGTFIQSSISGTFCNKIWIYSMVRQKARLKRAQVWVRCIELSRESKLYPLLFFKLIKNFINSVFGCFYIHNKALKRSWDNKEMWAKMYTWFSCIRGSRCGTAKLLSSANGEFSGVVGSEDAAIGDASVEKSLVVVHEGLKRLKRCINFHN